MRSTLKPWWRTRILQPHLHPPRFLLWTPTQNQWCVIQTAKQAAKLASQWTNPHPHGARTA